MQLLQLLCVRCCIQPGRIAAAAPAAACRLCWTVGRVVCGFPQSQRWPVMLLKGVARSAILLQCIFFCSLALLRCGSAAVRISCRLCAVSALCT